MTGREQFQKIKPIIELCSKILSLLGRKINNKLFLCFRNTSGKFGILIRYILLKNLALKLGDNVSIQPNVFLFNIQHITFGNNVSVHPMCYIEGAGGVVIGDNVSLAHASTIISTSHTWDNPNIPIKYNPETKGEVVLEDDIWIGCGVRILSGVKIKSRTVVAAGAIVNKSFEGGVVLAGIPATIKKSII